LVQGLRLYVLDGGSIIIDAPEKFGLTREQVKNSNMSCPVYLIVHPRGTLLFDTGLGDRYFGRPFNEALLGDPPNPLPLQSFVFVTKTVKSQLEAIGYPPLKIDFLTMSHPHADHIGNANDFAGSTLLVHKGDYDMMFGTNVQVNPAYAALKNSETKIIEGDYDVFGDGTVVLLFTPGHTPGHQSLYVKLAKTGDVVLSGDVYHYPEDLKLDSMPEREKGPGITEASRKKLQAFLAKTGAQLWVGHDINFFSQHKHAPEYYD
jgi:glyoxylase-like metal-dependent hydrolase (beta-lactamase superfamily II)